MSADTKKISLVKIRNNGGNAVVTIPRNVMRTANWQLGSQVTIQYDPVNDKIVISTINPEAFT
jgi:antitoxin component of MazEF toxin-antitoxin module